MTSGTPEFLYLKEGRRSCQKWSLTVNLGNTHRRLKSLLGPHQREEEPKGSKNKAHPLKPPSVEVLRTDRTISLLGGVTPKAENRAVPLSQAMCRHRSEVRGGEGRNRMRWEDTR